MTVGDVAISIMLSDIILLCGGAIGLIKWESLSRPTKAFTVYMIFCSAVELSQFIIIRLGYSPNFTGNVALIINVALIVYFYFLVLDLPTSKRVFISSYLVIVISFLLNLLFIQKSEPNSYSIVVRLLIVLVLGLFYFYRLLQGNANIKLTSSSIFWLNSGLVIEASGNLFLYLITDYLIHVLNNDMIVFTVLNYVFQIFVYIIFVIGIWLGAKEGKLKPSEN